MLTRQNNTLAPAPTGTHPLPHTRPHDPQASAPRAAAEPLAASATAAPAAMGERSPRRAAPCGSRHPSTALCVLTWHRTGWMQIKSCCSIWPGMCLSVLTPRLPTLPRTPLYPFMPVFTLLRCVAPQGWLQVRARRTVRLSTTGALRLLHHLTVWASNRVVSCPCYVCATAKRAGPIPACTLPSNLHGQTRHVPVPSRPPHSGAITTQPGAVMTVVTTAAMTVVMTGAGEWRVVMRPGASALGLRAL
jgi:hypothetical protein